MQAFGPYDPTATWTGDVLTKSFSAPNGPCTVTISRSQQGLAFKADGDDAVQVVNGLVSAAQADDGYHSFQPEHPALQKRLRQFPGLRLIRVPWLFDMASSCVLQQRVRMSDAMREWQRICTGYGEKTASGLLAFPSATVLSKAPPHALEGMGIDPRRSRILLTLAKELRLHPLTPAMTHEQLRLRLSRIPGIGPWTLEMFMGFGAADTDAAITGDLKIPHFVSHALTGEPRSTDQRMLELLEPFRPQRFRVIRLLTLG